ncbi:MAG TPA: hypothetical protein VFN71_12765 [Methylomirabilota bacterium]|nr:hypothetical protein [Methylomirabilota bacterium]
MPISSPTRSRRLRDRLTAGPIVVRPGASAPAMTNMVEGGKTPRNPTGPLERLGYRLVIFPNVLERFTTGGTR